MNTRNLSFCKCQHNCKDYCEIARKNRRRMPFGVVQFLWLVIIGIVALFNKQIVEGIMILGEMAKKLFL